MCECVCTSESVCGMQGVRITKRDWGLLLNFKEHSDQSTIVEGHMPNTKALTSTTTPP